MKYFDPTKNWKKVAAHLGDAKLNKILVRDFNKYTLGRWGNLFLPGMVPRDFESCDWARGRRGRPPAYHAYVKHSACHWLVGFHLRLAELMFPGKAWRIVSSPNHSTVWDGDDMLFDFNLLALGVPPDEAFKMAKDGGRELKPGEHIKLYKASHYSLDK